MGRIVVGVDGSDCSKEALVWAAKEAALRRAALEAVCAFHVPAGWLGLGDGTVMTDPVAVDDLERYAEATLNECLEQLPAEERPAEVRTTTALGRPGDVLIEASDGADLLVVGCRGRGDIGAVLLGSVGMHCVHHAPCPVVVVRHPVEVGEDEQAEPRRKHHGWSRHAKS